MNQQSVQLIANELLNRGVKPEVVSGVIAGIMGESGANLDPTAFNSKDPHGGAGGVAQWNADRLVGPNGMLAYAKAHGVDVDINTPTDSKKVPFAVQANFLGTELDNRYNGVLQSLRGATTGEEGLTTWVNAYESPQDKAGAINQRRQYIAQVAPIIGAKTPLVIASGGGAGSAGAGAAGSAPGAPAYAPPSPQQMLGQSLGAAIASMGGGGGGGTAPMPDPVDQPAIRSMAAQTDFMPSAPNPVPAQFTGGALGSQLGALAAQPNPSMLENPQDAPSITAGAPSMTSMLGDLGTTATPGLFDNRGGNQLTPNPYRRVMRLA